MRIVSLIASATEIACELGLRDQLVGRSHECDYPPSVMELPVLSAPKVDPALPGHMIDREVRKIVSEAMSVYRVDVGMMETLEPDLILTQDHCEVCAVSLKDVEDALCQLTNNHATICTLHPNVLGDVLEDITKVGTAAAVPDRGDALVARMQSRLDHISGLVYSAPIHPRVALIEWLEPPMIAGGWMPELAVIAGGHPVIVERADTFVTVSWDDIALSEPDHVIVMPCGYDLERTAEELRRDEVTEGLQSLVQRTGARCHVADGNAYFNRPGPRLADTAELMAGLLHPTLFPDFAARHKTDVAPWPSTASAASP